MSDDDKDTSKESGEKKRKKLSGSPFLKSTRFVRSESLEKENSKIESEVMSELGKRLVHVVESLASNSGEKVKDLLDQGAPVNHPDDFSGATALHYAASYNDIEVIEVLMAHPEINYLARDGQERLASELAGRAGNLELAEILIQKEKKQATERGIVAHLRYDAPIDDSSDNDSELGVQLIEAAKEPFNNGQEVKRLLDQGAPVNYQEEMTGATALHFAAGYNDMATVKIILAHPDVDCLIRDWQGRLAAELAEDNPKLADLILNKEAEQAKIKKIIPHMRHDEPFVDSSDNDDAPGF